MAAAGERVLAGGAAPGAGAPDAVADGAAAAGFAAAGAAPVGAAAAEAAGGCAVLSGAGDEQPADVHATAIARNPALARGKTNR